MITVIGIICWVGIDLPEKFKGLVGPFKLSAEDIVELTNKFDVAFMHTKPEKLSKKEIKMGLKQEPEELFLSLDEKGGKFRQR